MQLGGESPLPDYSEALAADTSKLLAAAKADGLYYIRVGNDVVASIPAKCWAVAGPTAEISIHALDTGAIVAASLSAPCGANIATPSDASQLRLPKIDTVQFLRPVPAPTVTLPAAGVGAQAAAVQQASNTAKEGNSQTAGGKKGEPEKPDERTWIQKNWLPLTLVAFMMVNRMGAPEMPADAPPGARALPAGASRPTGR